MEQATAVKNEKPRIKVGASIQGKVGSSNGKDNTPAAGKARYEKGLELYRAGAVSIGEDGYFRVLGFTVDTEKVSCDCPEYQKYKQPCLHYYAACIFQKNGCKVGSASNSENKARGKDFNFPRVNLRVKTLSLAIEVLQSHGKPITAKNLFKVAGELESWALGGE